MEHMYQNKKVTEHPMINHYTISTSFFWEGLNQYGSTSWPTPQCAKGMEMETGTVKVKVKVTILS